MLFFFVWAAISPWPLKEWISVCVSSKLRRHKHLKWQSVSIRQWRESLIKCKANLDWSVVQVSGIIYVICILNTCSWYPLYKVQSVYDEVNACQSS